MLSDRVEEGLTPMDITWTAFLCVFSVSLFLVAVDLCHLPDSEVSSVLTTKSLLFQVERKNVTRSLPSSQRPQNSLRMQGLL